MPLPLEVVQAATVRGREQYPKRVSKGTVANPLRQMSRPDQELFTTIFQAEAGLGLTV